MTKKEERQELLAVAKELGLSFPKNAPFDRIQSEVEAKRQEFLSEDAESEIDEDYGDEEEDDLIEESDEEVSETPEQMEARLKNQFDLELAKRTAEITAQVEENLRRNESSDMNGIRTRGMAKVKKVKAATKLKRVIVTCRNPMKASWEGEIFSVGNDVVGSFTKYIPFGLESGYHVPQIILDTMNDKQCTVFVNGKTKNGEKVKVGKLIKEFGIEVLEPLTEQEISELATEQKARGSIDS